MQQKTQEIEQKWRITRCDFSNLPEYQKFLIVQTYLVIPEKEKMECRVRKVEIAGETFFYYTEKSKIAVGGVRDENEKMIEESEYQEYLLFIDSICKPIKKTRYVFQKNGCMWELDIYQEDIDGLIILECEVLERSKLTSLILPDFLEGFVVTSDVRYTNRQLAEFGIPKI